MELMNAALNAQKVAEQCSKTHSPDVFCGKFYK